MYELKKNVSKSNLTDHCCLFRNLVFLCVLQDHVTFSIKSYISRSDLDLFILLLCCHELNISYRIPPIKCITNQINPVERLTSCLYQHEH
jgi:hypothetical protein